AGAARPALMRAARALIGGHGRAAGHARAAAPDWGLPAGHALPPRPLAPQVEVAPEPLLQAPLAPPQALAPAAAPSPSPEMQAKLAAAGGHAALWMAATALIPLPPFALSDPAPGRAKGPAFVPPPVAPARRWSADGWLLLRPDPQGPIAPGPLPGTYGASQAGAVIRYRLAPSSPNKPSVYARAALAIGQTRQHEAALGLSLRPVSALPLVVMAEGRVTEGKGSTARLRPALTVVTELPPQKLGAGFVGEAYVQGGWVGGPKPTGFIDGLARAERPVADLGEDLTLKAGAGIWGAKQRGASRLDLGPVASLTVRLGNAGPTARIEADYRLRVAGRSRPESGPVLTLSTGF
ncbi:hypothetical protein H7F51_00005, partial [Novosphingobium flavum]